ncbi:hypothetical protein TVAG_316790 [Trichomonas vaginalis G3]|uniref:Uncharacterized protein n=1 Tax=Trichomonas vaginalis (strain ATCC PRA-98 / G3) TaxID=412133 RepID=A2F057_TRIV3|nr:hypothetical protein TVAGG3_0985480 [Trichomonas vaginalis G3]EAY01692.1 hypothetical protein TVAG_316790 [Trichomonas vaginalis G3]KAI5489627.1 hypothetical protein TVAGG3_0985480 [Trichomonas vaginalis G3]|eukprot:XP_001330388.1 hypothetical protein [Trichomonas vaginalis G3]
MENELYVNNLVKIRTLIHENSKNKNPNYTKEELDGLVSNLEPMDFASYGKDICKLYSSAAKTHNNAFSTNVPPQNNPEFPKFTFRKIKKQTYDLNIEGTSKYYPTYPEWICKSFK